MKNSVGQLLQRNRFLLAIFAGLSLTAAFPKIGLAGLAWVAPAFMLAAAQGRTGLEAFRIGYVAGLMFNLGALYWLLHIPVTGYPILGWLALSAYLALYPGVWVWLLAGKLSAGGWPERTGWALAGAALWVALEMIVGRLFSGFPWLFVGNSQFQLLPFIQIASVTGVYGVSFLVVWFSLALYSAALAILRQPTLRQAWMSEIALPLIAVLGVFAFGVSRLREPVFDDSTVRVTFIQPAIPQTMIWDVNENTNRFQQLLDLTAEALNNARDNGRPAQLLLWPEAALPQFDDESFIAITNLIRTYGVWMILGADEVEWQENAPGQQEYTVYNSAFLFAPTGQCTAIYRKRNLVIFGEYIPLVRWLPFVKWLTPIGGGFTAGDRVVSFVLDPLPLDVTSAAGDSASSESLPQRAVRTASLICFEDVFPSLVREYVDGDTDFLVNLTNDGWFGESAEQWQHAASAVYRAVENDVPLLRCCNNGLTCWIDGRGRMRDIFRDKTGGIYGTGHVTTEIPLLRSGERRVMTFYNRHGDWFGWSCVAAATLTLIPHIRSLVRHRRGR
ncbi:MAG: apolipoprotein N-acyltransferase [Verrucomicrobiae bacterium]|nr:apolipoprotein N-acyltransferase [Verrucomicrobiae bacterium]